MTTYYYEVKGCGPGGQFEADSDIKAKRKVPKDCMFLYKENETEDGPQFIVIEENKDET